MYRRTSILTNTLIMSDYYNKTGDYVFDGLAGNPFQSAGSMHAIAVNGQTGNRGSRNALDPSCASNVLRFR